MAEQSAAPFVPQRRQRNGIVRSVLEFIGEITSLAAQSGVCLIRGRIALRDAVTQMATLGIDSLPIVVVTALSTGAVFAFYTTGVFVRFGAGRFVGGTLTLSFLMELGPLLAGISVAARSGAAIAAEIGSMVVTEQVDALRAMAVSPVRYLVAPRVLACVAMMPICCLFADTAGVVGSILMSSINGVPQQTFIESARTFVTEADLLKGVIKTLWFGLTIASVACRQGLRVHGGATGVGRGTTSSVVLCIVLVFVSDFFLAQALSGPSITIR